MTILRLRSHKPAGAACFVLAFAIIAGVRPATAEDVSARVKNSVVVLNQLTNSSNVIQPEQIANTDCVAVIPGLKKGAAVVGVSYGKGFISCRTGDTWSAPAAITLGGGSLGVQLGGEKFDVVILSLDQQYRSKLLSDRFTFGSDASAAWGNGKTAHGDPDAKILFFGKTKGVFAGFDLDGTTLQPDNSTNKAIYGKSITNSEIVNGGTAAPATVQLLVTNLSSLLHRESAGSSSSASVH